MSDRNLHSFYETSNGQAVALDTVGGGWPVDWSDTIKITSQCTGLRLTADEILGGTEDCVDINNGCRDIKVTSLFHAQGKYVATIKGGAEEVTLSGIVTKHGTEVDIDLGNWSDQSSAPVRGVRLDLKSITGLPIVVRVLNAAKPTLAGAGPYRFAFPHPDAWYHGLAVWFFLAFCRATRAAA